MRKMFRLGTSPTIGTLILPGEPLIKIAERLDATIKLTIEPCDKIIAGVKNKTYELGLIESPIFDDELVYKEWMEDELVICSLNPLPENLAEEDLSHCTLLCRNTNSPTRVFINDFFNKVNLSYETFYSLSEIDNASAAIQGIKWSKPNKEHPTVAIVSELAIEEELKKDTLHRSRIKGKPMIRKFYLIYDRSEGTPSYVEDIITYLREEQ
ncbi:transcriptional regulator, LysR family [hydrothermal vent metagenome]|uniref:Transcriptional regulator, LysR family n=1 Tax=hydrothermal vent metagenome TaxID=652676 RepID=A0A1W1BZE7_9ZZZZ